MHVDSPWMRADELTSGGASWQANLQGYVLQGTYRTIPRVFSRGSTRTATSLSYVGLPYAYPELL